MKEVIITKDNLPMVIKYEQKEYADEDEKKSVLKQVNIVLHDLEKDEVNEKKQIH